MKENLQTQTVHIHLQLGLRNLNTQTHTCTHAHTHSFIPLEPYFLYDYFIYILSIEVNLAVLTITPVWPRICVALWNRNTDHHNASQQDPGEMEVSCPWPLGTEQSKRKIQRSGNVSWEASQSGIGPVVWWSSRTSIRPQKTKTTDFKP